MTDGGIEPTSNPAGGQASWPGPPPGNWGDSPLGATTPTAGATSPLPNGPASPPRSGRRIVELAVVVLLTAAIVALAFTSIGGGPGESSAESKFITVGSSISTGDPDRSSGGWDTIPMEDEEPAIVLEDVMPTDDDVEALVPAMLGEVSVEYDDPTDPGPGGDLCTEIGPEVIDGYARVWVDGDGYVGVDVRVQETTSAAEARHTMDLRTGKAYLECVTTKYGNVYGDGDVVDGKVIDSSDTGSGDQRQVSVLVEDASGVQKVLAWRQVGTYVITALVVGVDPSHGSKLDLHSADDLIDLPATALGG